MYITVWQRLNKNSGIFEHNHIEDGLSDREAPVAISDHQMNCWKGAVWKKLKGQLVNGKVTNLASF